MEITSDQDSEVSQDKLDVEYRKILRIIKPYIQTINNNNYLSQYRVWLEKLSDAKEEEKYVRNQYLMELARQIQRQHLATPFTQKPPVDSLQPFRNQWSIEPNTQKSHDISSGYCVTDVEVPMHQKGSSMNKQMMCEQWTKNNEDLHYSPIPVKADWPFHTSSQTHASNAYNEMIPQTLNEKGCISDNQLSEQKSKRKLKSINSRRMSLLQGIDEHMSEKYMELYPSSSFQVPHSENPFDLSIPVEFNLKIDSAVTHNRPHELGGSPAAKTAVNEETNLIEESSWCDLTDTSTTSLAVLASGDSEKRPHKPNVESHKAFESKINTLMSEINGLKKKNVCLNDNSSNLKTTQEAPAMLSFSEDVENLRYNSHELSEVKYALKDANFIASDWKKTVESLQVRLSETQNQNRDFNEIICSLQKKIEDMESVRIQENYEYKKYVSLEHEKELQTLKSKQTELLQSMELTFQEKLNRTEEDFQKKLADIEASYDKKNRETTEEHAKVVKERDREITRLEEIVQKQCVRLINEINSLKNRIEEASNSNNTNDERILFLQKCITKMDRLFQKSEREYCRQIEKLKQELDNREKATQIQLQTQRADVITRCSAEKQAELDIIVQNLETRYTKLLQMQQTQNNIIKSEDEQTIYELKQLLEKHDIQY